MFSDKNFLHWESLQFLSWGLRQVKCEPTLSNNHQARLILSNVISDKEGVRAILGRSNVPWKILSIYILSSELPAGAFIVQELSTVRPQFINLTRGPTGALYGDLGPDMWQPLGNQMVLENQTKDFKVRKDHSAVDFCGLAETGCTLWLWGVTGEKLCTGKM